MLTKEENKIEIKNNLNFVQGLAKYFMDFLETDFHKRKKPKRSIKFKNNNNLLIGINLSKYSSFHNVIWRFINNGFYKDNLSIKEGIYKNNILENLLDLIKVKIDKSITNEKFIKIINLISEKIKEIDLSNKKRNQLPKDKIEQIKSIIESELVIPITSSFNEIINSNLLNEDEVYLIGDELTEIVFSLLSDNIYEIIKYKDQVNTKDYLSDIFNISDIKTSIYSFFKTFQVYDLFKEICEIIDNRTILEKQEFYLYFCDITFNKSKYPIFYIPLDINKQNDVLKIEFDYQIYINKKAIEYIAQEYNRENSKKGQLISEKRIIYLSEDKEDFLNSINKILSELTTFFKIDKNIDLNNYSRYSIKNSSVKLSNNCYLALFDKSDQSLINDYEDILKNITNEDSALSGAFNKLINDFINEDPRTFNSIVEEEWENTSISSRLVFNSPVPLNEEQLQILSAIKKDDCKYITIEGPPGTGKSHTITAIIFDFITNNKSVLILSDKKEALDVVEEKITKTINKVRFGENFQNPILRLGKTGSTYSKILNNSSIEDIKIHYRTIKNKYSILEKNIKKLSDNLKEGLENEISSYSKIDIQDIYNLYLNSYNTKKHDLLFDIDELLIRTEAIDELIFLRDTLLSLKEKIKNIEYGNIKEIESFELPIFTVDKSKDLRSFQKYLRLVDHLTKSITEIKKNYKDEISLLKNFEKFNISSLVSLEKFIAEYEKEKSFIFKYYFKKNKINRIDEEFKNILQFNVSLNPHTILDDLKKLIKFCKIFKEKERKIKVIYKANFDYLRFIHYSTINDLFLDQLYDLLSISNSIDFIETCFTRYPKTLKKLKVDLSSFSSILFNRLTRTNNHNFSKLVKLVNELIEFIKLRKSIDKSFNSIPLVNYEADKNNIEYLITARTAFILDSRLINFYENSKSTATALRSIIKKKQRFPKKEFLKLKEAFPCILSGIRDYAEYIPLEPEIFDIIIIDEASQVSIAQAFPALLRAKKILVLGDKKQFSNVKSALAKSDTNKVYLSNLKDLFTKYVSNEEIKLIKFEKFNIKTSILEFFEFIANYNIQLLKHFRSYKEIISYSNKYFYNNNLQVMKIRGKLIDEVIKFSFINHDGKQEKIVNTNQLEAEFIIDQLKNLKNTGSSQSVGIITPHTNQQKLLVDLISKIPEKDYLCDKLSLKIMTFDSCQGEERDLILYSMVATENDDHLWGIFIKNLSDIDIDDESRIKAQRLNVGLSRAKETIHFILSKPIDKYSGSIGEAIRYYHNIMVEAKKEKSINTTDKNSKMEPEVLNWFYQTAFWQNNKNKENIEFTPQFELGKYLKQLDRNYNQPSYRVDFLLIYKDENSNEHKIIIEYDGFKEHFKNTAGIDKFNYQNYYTEKDVYRQKILESYGYKFLRINKFNIGDNPISVLNDRIYELIKKNEKKFNLTEYIQDTGDEACKYITKKESSS